MVRCGPIGAVVRWTAVFRSTTVSSEEGCSAGCISWGTGLRWLTAERVPAGRAPWRRGSALHGLRKVPCTGSTEDTEVTSTLATATTLRQVASRCVWRPASPLSLYLFAAEFPKDSELTCCVVIYIIKTRQIANKGRNYHFCYNTCATGCTNPRSRFW
jgi:hypothetical protein